MAKKKKPKNKRTLEEARSDLLLAIENAVLRQDARWRALSKAVDYAGNNVMIMRQDALDDRLAEHGYPLWMGAVIALAVAIIPVEALAASALTKLLGFSRQALASVRFPTASEGTRFLRVTDLQTIAKSSAAPSRLARDVLENDKRVVQIVNMYKPEVSGAIQGILNNAAEAGIRPLFGSPGKAPHRQKQFRATDRPLVVIQKALNDWIICSQFAEGLAINILKANIRDANEIIVDDIDALIASFEEISGVAAFNQGPDLFQQFIEKCMWCTTYNLAPVLASVGIPGNVIEIVIAPEYGEEFWDRLTSHFIDPSSGQSFKDTKYYPESSPNEKHAKRLEIFPHWGSASALRLSYHFNDIRREITKQNSETATLLLKTFQRERR